MTHKRTIPSPLGPLTIEASSSGITALHWGGAASDTSPLLVRAARELDDYFAGTLRDFTLPFDLRTTAFQRDVCTAIAAIPFGQTRTYGDLARDLGVTAQAIGQGCGGNPIPILIPCHRVLAADGLGGYSGKQGIETKVWLLKHEGAASLLI